MDDNPKKDRIEEIKNFVDPTKKPCFYQNEDFISDKEYEFIRRELNPTQRRLLVPAIYEVGTVHFNLESKCPICKKTEIIRISPSSVYGTNGCMRWRRMCKDCEEKKKADEIKETEKFFERKNAEYEKRKEIFLTYISPNYSFRQGMKPVEKVRALEQVIPLFKDFEPFAEQLQELDYGDFLNTPYWKATACKIRYKYKYKCALCNGEYNLCVQHKTYEHHGYEWFYPEDLILLCSDCHEKFHDMEEE